MRPEQVVDTQEVLPRNGQLFLSFGTIDDVQLRRTQMKMRMTSGNVLLVFSHSLFLFFLWLRDRHALSWGTRHHVLRYDPWAPLCGFFANS